MTNKDPKKNIVIDTIEKQNKNGKFPHYFIIKNVNYKFLYTHNMLNIELIMSMRRSFLSQSKFDYISK